MRAAEESDRCVVGIDIGGANLKYASADGRSVASSFPLWRQPHQLASALASGLVSFKDVDALAVTMTGELADCFADRRAGVRHIVNQVDAAARQLAIDQVMFYAVDGSFLSANEARDRTTDVASANWHALASQVAAGIAGEGLLVDIGSTTTDLIPLRGGAVATESRTDHQRLAEGSLVYVGCRRTPVCALVSTLDFRGRSIAIMNELFATIDDAFLVLGVTAPDSADCSTADGQPRTVICAAARLARMIGIDAASINAGDVAGLARQIVRAGQNRIRQSMQRLDRGGTLILAGHGNGLIQIPRDRESVLLADSWGIDAARCAPSVAVARLFATTARGPCGAS